MLSQRKGFQGSTYFLAVSYLDEICSRYNFRAEELPLITVICLTMAAKMDEHEENIPDINSTSALLGEGFPIQKIIEAEQIVCKELGFRLCRDTAFHFGQFFLSRGVVNISDLRNSRPEFENDLLEKFESFTMLLIKYTSFDYSLSHQTSPSLVAACAVACTRRLFGFASWTPELALFTQKTEADMESCSILMWDLFLEKDADAFKESLAPLFKSGSFSLKGAHEPMESTTAADTVNDGEMEMEDDEQECGQTESLSPGKKNIRPRLSVQDTAAELVNLGKRSGNERQRYSARECSILMH